MKKLVSKLAVILVAGIIAAGIFMECRKETSSPQSPSPRSEKTAQYTCPMHPEVIQTGPGKCPICGMNLVPKAPVSPK